MLGTLNPPFFVESLNSLTTTAEPMVPMMSSFQIVLVL